MGELIRKNASAEDILSDVKTTYGRAVERGGVWKEEAEKRFSATLPVVEGIEAQLAEAEEKLLPLKARADIADDDSDALTHRIYDEIFNDLGRPRSDPMLQVIFPDGVGGLVNTDQEGQPERMELIAKLFEGRFHPRIDPEKSAGYATELFASAQKLREANESLAGPRAEIKQLQRVRIALARSARVELTRFKKSLLAEGFSEADIHQVIPDRPSTKKKPAA